MEERNTEPEEQEQEMTTLARKAKPYVERAAEYRAGRVALELVVVVGGLLSPHPADSIHANAAIERLKIRTRRFVFGRKAYKCFNCGEKYDEMHEYCQNCHYSLVMERSEEDFRREIQ